MHAILPYFDIWHLRPSLPYQFLLLLSDKEIVTIRNNPEQHGSPSSIDFDKYRLMRLS